MVRELPSLIETSLPELLDAGLSGDDISSLARINESLMTATSGLLLDVTFARIGCEGGSRTSLQAAEAPPLAQASKATSPTRAA
jgi:hypothetical protein